MEYFYEFYFGLWNYWRSLNITAVLEQKLGWGVGWGVQKGPPSHCVFEAKKPVSDRVKGFGTSQLKNEIYWFFLLLIIKRILNSGFLQVMARLMMCFEGIQNFSQKFKAYERASESMESVTHQVLITKVAHIFWPTGQQELCSKAGSISLAEYPVEFETVTFWSRVQHFEPWSQSSQFFSLVFVIKSREHSIGIVQFPMVNIICF